MRVSVLYKIYISITSTELATFRYVDCLISYSQMPFPVRDGVVLWQCIRVVSVSVHTVGVCVLFEGIKPL
jgi:hypothetical protein